MGAAACLPVFTLRVNPMALLQGAGRVHSGEPDVSRIAGALRAAEHRDDIAAAAAPFRRPPLGVRYGPPTGVGVRTRGCSLRLVVCYKLTPCMF